jgi:hypothetical protein
VHATGETFFGCGARRRSGERPGKTHPRRPAPAGTRGTACRPRPCSSTSRGRGSSARPLLVGR